ncbi:UvrD-helicase domain-containing protein [Eubacterium sp. MSJ-33]|uniref:UvrD-helicase domain-containing protein n=1 Tax=Eubacterium sp. MSJ-33 TaxID=2841528 RepID=UPI001C783C82|nr:UvrD-helicase domain-containing protein [Eubacterium sp. MSJ-33]QWT52778.1 UvrD-helicase domain-containing protein [Eubacterium sp. MSJ-33]
MLNEKEKELRDALGLLKPEDGSKNYSVKAGAGGGKTTTLSQRICNQIVSGVPAEEFVIITYTNAAAAELRDKITDALRKKLEKKETLSETQIGYVKNALASMDLMQISTIHSFLLKILREHTFEAGITLDAELLEEDKNEKRKEKFFNTWYKNHMDEIDAIGEKDDWKHIAKKGGQTEHRREVFKNMFFDLADVREDVRYCLSDPAPELAKEAQVYVDTWKQKFLNYELEFKSNQPMNKNGKLKKVNAKPQSILDAIDKIKGKTVYNADDACSVADALCTIVELIADDYNFFGKTGGVSNPIGSLRAVIDTFVLDADEMKWNFGKRYNAAMDAYKRVAPVVSYVCEMQKAYQKEIDANTRELSNNDILYRTDRLLKQHPDVLDELRMRYSKIYVDEFQDTTGLQAGIVLQLSEKPGTKLEDYDLQEDKLLVVGDPKQSIYRFTGAEKAVYDKVDHILAEKADTLAQSVVLHHNFRSNAAIVNWVNNSYRVLMGADYDEMETDWSVTDTQALHGVYRYVPKQSGDGENSEQESDAEAVRGLIEELVGKPYCFVEQCHRNPDGTFAEPELRRIRYSDIMVLFRNTTKMDVYDSVLKQAGIPTAFQGKQKVAGEEVLQNFVILMEYMASWSGKRELAAIQVVQGLDVTNTDPESIKKAAGKLRELKNTFADKNMGSAAVAQYLLSHPELYMPKEKEQTLEDVKRYQTRLHQMVEACIQKNDGDMRILADRMREYLAKKVEREVPLENQENAVRLMNVHKSKGLTGQIVIIADRSNQEGCWYGAFRSAGKYYPVARYRYSAYGNMKSVTSPAYVHDRNLLDQAYREETEEAIRLQYVAATRAAQALIIMPALGNNVWFSNPAYGYDKLPDIQTWLSERAGDAAVKIDAERRPASVTNKNCADLQVQVALKDAMQDGNPYAENTLTSITPSGLEAPVSTGYASGKDEEYVREERPKGDVFGDVMHRVYELLIMRFNRIIGMSDPERETAVAQAINQAILEHQDAMRANDHPDEYFSFLKRVMVDQGYLKDVIAPILSSAEAVYPEYAFSFYVPEAEQEQFKQDFAPYLKLAKVESVADKIWVNGKADLVVVNKDGLVKVYDYKSDSRNGKPLADFETTLAGKYAGQLALYRYAIGKAFGVTRVETELIHLYRKI